MPSEKCPEHDGISRKLDEMHNDLRAILERLGRGDVTFATTVLRVDQIEKVVYGAMGLALTAVVGAIISLVVKSH